MCRENWIWWSQQLVSENVKLQDFSATNAWVSSTNPHFFSWIEFWSFEDVLKTFTLIRFMAVKQKLTSSPSWAQMLSSFGNHILSLSFLLCYPSFSKWGSGRWKPEFLICWLGQWLVCQHWSSVPGRAVSQLSLLRVINQDSH